MTRLVIAPAVDLAPGETRLGFARALIDRADTDDALVRQLALSALVAHLAHWVPERKCPTCSRVRDAAELAGGVCDDCHERGAGVVVPF